jgi:lipoprotein-anchoring transpeptidase ErfK/SrfK
VALWRRLGHGSYGFRLFLVIPAAVGLAVALPLLADESRSQVGAESRRSVRDETSSLLVPRPVKPAFVPGKPTALRTSPDIARWAVVRTAVAARARPSSRAPIVAHVGTQTPEGTSNIVLVLGSRFDRADDLWIHVRLPAFGPSWTGWLPRNALGGYGTVATHLVVNLKSLRATLFRNGRAIFHADVGIGKQSWPTPRGEFYVRNKLTGFASPMYGPVAFGTSARSSVLTDWPAGGYVGIHGTDEPDLLPGRVSHGCIRMRNLDIVRLAMLMPIGTPLTIR